MVYELPPVELITPVLLAACDRPGPRYTSYPTALEFSDAWTADHYLKRLSALRAATDHPVSIYVHIPFCRRRCAFCGCNTALCRNDGDIDRYLQALHREIDLVASALPFCPQVAQLHLGGGTPTILSAPQLEALISHLRSHFSLIPEAEVSIEVNPAVTSATQIRQLRELGFNRLSAGVQDFDPEVLRASGRMQSPKDTDMLVREARASGFSSLNIDLMYGLPGQTPDRFCHSLDRVALLRPERIALYSFAYMPWLKDNQKELDEAKLPSRDVKFSLFIAALQRLIMEGYLPIGMDHFALSDDAMGQALAAGTLHRNFMGYTVGRYPVLLGFGASAIGSTGDSFNQNLRSTDAYISRLAADQLPVEKGLSLTRDDRIRQDVIEELMCRFRISYSELSARWDIDGRHYFAAERAQLATQRSGEVPFTEEDESGLTVTPMGRLFVRNIAMVFDRHLKKHADRPAFSRTV